MVLATVFINFFLLQEIWHFYEKLISTWIFWNKKLLSFFISIEIIYAFFKFFKQTHSFSSEMFRMQNVIFLSKLYSAKIIYYAEYISETVKVTRFIGRLKYSLYRLRQMVSDHYNALPLSKYT